MAKARGLKPRLRVRYLTFPTVRFHSVFGALRASLCPVVFFEGVLSCHTLPLFVEGIVACDRRGWQGWFNKKYYFLLLDTKDCIFVTNNRLWVLGKMTRPLEMALSEII